MILVVSTASYSVERNTDDAYRKSEKFISSIEWDPYFPSKIEDYREFIPDYYEGLRSSDKNILYTSIIMLSLLKEIKALESIGLVQSDSEAISVIKAFSICYISKKCEKEIKYLTQLGKETITVEGALSLKNLYVVELLSLLMYEDFEKYLSELKTDETFQRESLYVSKVRHENIMKTNN